jgi:replicative DNA helicase
MSARPAVVDATDGSDAEASVLGAVLLHPATFAQVHKLLTPRDFIHPAHRATFEAMHELARLGRPIDTLTVEAWMRANGTLERLRICGGADYLLDLQTRVVSIETVDHHARMVAENAVMRRAREGSRSLQQAGTLEQIQRTVRDIEEDIARFTSPADAELPSPADALARAEWSRPMPTPRSTGLEPLDVRLGGGLMEQATYLIVGAEGRGKSGFTIQLLREMARHAPVAYISAELPVRQVLARFAAQSLEVSWLDLLRLEPNAAHVVADALAGLPIYVHQLSRAEPVTAFVARVADAAGKAPVFAVDYVQKAARRGGAADYRFAVSACMDEIVQCALDYHTSALAVSSTGRANAQGAAEQSDARVLAQTAKENGDLEYDASGVIYLDVAERDADGTAPTRLVVGKSRFGTDGVVGMRFDGRVGVFHPDRASALSALDRKVLDAIREGAETTAQIREVVGRRRDDVLKALKRLAPAGLIIPTGERSGGWRVA